MCFRGTGISKWGTRRGLEIQVQTRARVELCCRIESTHMHADGVTNATGTSAFGLLAWNWFGVWS